MPSNAIKESPRVKEHFHLRNPSDPNNLDRVTRACYYEELPSYMDVQWSEIERARRAHVSERQEQRLSSLIDVLDTDEGQYMITKIIDYTLAPQKTVSLPRGSIIATLY